MCTKRSANMYKAVQIIKGCAKGLLIVLNLLCILVALCTFGFTMVDINVLKQYGEEQSNGTMSGDITVAIASCLLVAVALFGCVAVARNHVKMLYLYVCFVLALIVCEVMIAIFVSIQRYDLQFRVTEWIREDFYKNGTEHVGHEKLWDDLQITGKPDYSETVSCKGTQTLLQSRHA